MFRVLLLAGLTGVVAFGATGGAIDHYSQTSKKLIDTALDDMSSMDRLAYLCDRIGNRVSGSAALEQAIRWAAEEMRKAGFENVRTQPVKVPHWIRGTENAVLLEPVQRALIMLGLGNSIGTGPGGIAAEVVVVSNFTELQALGASKIRGKIVLFNAPYNGYGRTVAYRAAGPSRAAALGAVAALVRSVTPLAMRIPHTGALRYSEDAPQIPAAAITIEDAESIARMIRKGSTVRVKLSMDAHFEPEAQSANVMGEITGTEKPNEIVALGGHIDSWDVGQGAQDNGSGVMASFEALALMKRLGLKPRRTIRVVLWTNEENGGAGGRAYRDSLGESVKDHVAAIEMDGGAEKALGFGVSGLSASAMERLQEIGKLLAPINASQILTEGGGADIRPLMDAGVPGLGQISSGTHYFDWHHTEADTFDKIKPSDFRECVASLAVMSYVLADMPERLTDFK